MFGLSDQSERDGRRESWVFREPNFVSQEACLSMTDSNDVSSTPTRLPSSGSRLKYTSL